MKELKIEITRFIKDKKKILLIGSIFIAILLSAFYVVNEIYFSTSETEESEITNVSGVQNENSGYFQIYIENEENGEPFINNGLLTNVFYSEDVLDEVDSLVSINLIELVQEQELRREVASDDLQRLIEVSLSSSSNIITVYAHTDVKTDNLTILNYYHDLIFDGSIPFLEGKEVYLLTEPGLMDSVGNQQAKDEQRTLENQINYPVLSIIFLLGLVAGLIMMIVILYSIELFSKKINYSFTYFSNADEQFFLYDIKLENEKEMNYFIYTPKVTRKMILSESNMSELTNIIDNTSHQKNDIAEDKNIILANNIMEQHELDHISEIIIVLFSGTTTRAWFNQQIKLLEIPKHIPIKILQINE